MKTVLLSALAFAGLTGFALAQEAPITIGDYSPGLLSHADNVGSTEGSTVTSRHAISTMRRDGGIGPEMPCVLGNSGSDVTCDSIYSGR